MRIPLWSLSIGIANITTAHPIPTWLQNNYMTLSLTTYSKPKQRALMKHLENSIFPIYYPPTKALSRTLGQEARLAIHKNPLSRVPSHPLPTQIPGVVPLPNRSRPHQEIAHPLSQASPAQRSHLSESLNHTSQEPNVALDDPSQPRRTKPSSKATQCTASNGP
jgi:hypothetical protein